MDHGHGIKSIRTKTEDTDKKGIDEKEEEEE